MEVRYLTVGVAQENTWIARRDGAETADEPVESQATDTTTAKAERAPAARGAKGRRPPSRG